MPGWCKDFCTYVNLLSAALTQVCYSARAGCSESSLSRTHGRRTSVRGAPVQHGRNGMQKLIGAGGGGAHGAGGGGNQGPGGGGGGPPAGGGGGGDGPRGSA